MSAEHNNTMTRRGLLRLIGRNRESKEATSFHPLFDSSVFNRRDLFKFGGNVALIATTGGGFVHAANAEVRRSRIEEEVNDTQLMDTPAVSPYFKDEYLEQQLDEANVERDRNRGMAAATIAAIPLLAQVVFRQRS